MGKFVLIPKGIIPVAWSGFEHATSRFRTQDTYKDKEKQGDRDDAQEITAF